MHSTVWQGKELLLHTCKQHYPIFIFRSCESHCNKVVLQQNRKLDVYMGNTKSKYSKPPSLDFDPGESIGRKRGFLSSRGFILLSANIKERDGTWLKGLADVFMR